MATTTKRRCFTVPPRSVADAPPPGGRRSWPPPWHQNLAWCRHRARCPLSNGGHGLLWNRPCPDGRRPESADPGPRFPPGRRHGHSGRRTDGVSDNSENGRFMRSPRRGGADRSRRRRSPARPAPRRCGGRPAPVAGRGWPVRSNRGAGAGCRTPPGWT